MTRKKAIILLSGGLDSATVLYWAQAKGLACTCLIMDYHQRHRKEIRSAKAIATKAGCPYQVMRIAFPWGGSALLNKQQKLPAHQVQADIGKKIPLTYVPSRNIIFLSFAASYAEAVGARTILIGANSVDYSGYPDCRPEFISAFNQALKKGTKAGSEKKDLKVCAPLIHMRKAQIIRLGQRLKVPYELTWSCYQGHKKPCTICDSCQLRQRGFSEAKKEDPCLL